MSLLGLSESWPKSPNFSPLTVKDLWATSEKHTCCRCPMLHEKPTSFFLYLRQMTEVYLRTPFKLFFGFVCFCQIESLLTFHHLHTQYANHDFSHKFYSFPDIFFLSQNVSQTHQPSLNFVTWSELQSHQNLWLHQEILMLEQGLIYVLADGWWHW